MDIQKLRKLAGITEAVSTRTLTEGLDLSVPKNLEKTVGTASTSVPKYLFVPMEHGRVVEPLVKAMGYKMLVEMSGDKWEKYYDGETDDYSIFTIGGNLKEAIALLNEHGLRKLGIHVG